MGDQSKHGKLKRKIQINDTIIVVNGERVGNDLSTLQSPKRPLCIEFSRTVSVEVIKDEATEYYTDEELTNSEDIPNETGINNSNIESFDRGDSMESTEVELRKIRKKETENEQEEDNDDRDYTSDNGETSNDNDTDDESKESEEEERKGNNRIKRTLCTMLHRDLL